MLKSEHRCAGIVTTDPLRLSGLEQMLCAHGFDETVSLSDAGALKGHSLSLVVIDAARLEHLFELLAAFRAARPKLKLIVIGLSEEFQFIEHVIGAGAKGYLTHTARESEIQLALDIVLDGSIWAPRKVLARLLERANSELAESAESANPSFTERELQVLHLLVDGRSNREIAGLMEIDEGTVKAHVGRLMRKVGVRNRTALTVQAIHRKLV